MYKSFPHAIMNVLAGAHRGSPVRTKTKTIVEKHTQPRVGAQQLITNLASGKEAIFVLIYLKFAGHWRSW